MQLNQKVDEVYVATDKEIYLHILSIGGTLFILKKHMNVVRKNSLKH